MPYRYRRRASSEPYSRLGGVGCREPSAENLGVGLHVKRQEACACGAPRARALGIPMHVRGWLGPRPARRPAGLGAEMAFLATPAGVLSAAAAAGSAWHCISTSRRQGRGAGAASTCLMRLERNTKGACFECAAAASSQFPQPPPMRTCSGVMGCAAAGGRTPLVSTSTRQHLPFALATSCSS